MYTYKFKLTRVIDGDTVDGIIDLGFGIAIQHRVRLIGINTPETRTTNIQEKVVGNLAKARIKELLTGQLTIKTHKDTAGKFGRILGELFNGNSLNINTTLLEEKLAMPYGVKWDEGLSKGLIRSS